MALSARRKEAEWKKRASDLVADERDVRISGVFEGLIRNQSRRKNREKFKYFSSAQAEQDAVRLEKNSRLLTSLVEAKKA